MSHVIQITGGDRPSSTSVNQSFLSKNDSIFTASLVLLSNACRAESEVVRPCVCVCVFVPFAGVAADTCLATNFEGLVVPQYGGVTVREMPQCYTLTTEEIGKTCTEFAAADADSFTSAWLQYYIAPSPTPRTLAATACAM